MFGNTLSHSLTHSLLVGNHFGTHSLTYGVAWSYGDIPMVGGPMVTPLRDCFRRYTVFVLYGSAAQSTSCVLDFSFITQLLRVGGSTPAVRRFTQPRNVV